MTPPPPRSSDHAAADPYWFGCTAEYRAAVSAADRFLSFCRFDAAERLFVAALLDDPDAVTAEIGLASAFLTNPSRPWARRLELALFHIYEALDRAPEHPEALRLYTWSGEINRALIDA